VQEKDVLLRQALEDEDSRQKLYRGVAIYAHRLLGPCEPEAAHARAEEIVQEAVVQALAKIDTYDSARPAVNWLLGFAINVIRQAQRDQGHAAAIADNTPLDRLEDLVDRFHGQEAQELLSLVSAPDQEVLRLAIIEELSGRELAAELGISEGAARVRLYRAKQQLRRAYEQYREKGTV
jgi:RNA polymerase sigma factor (sigma-70 family)